MVAESESALMLHLDLSDEQSRVLSHGAEEFLLLALWFLPFLRPFLCFLWPRNKEEVL